MGVKRALHFTCITGSHVIVDCTHSAIKCFYCNAAAWPQDGTSVSQLNLSKADLVELQRKILLLFLNDTVSR